MTMRRLGFLAGFFAFALMALAVGAAERSDSSSSLAGQFLVASPEMPDPRFAQTVVYLVSHDEHGAMGLIVNRNYGRGPLKSLLQGFGVEKAKAEETVVLHYGGPVEQIRGFVLHSADYSGPSTQVVAGDVALSTGFDVLKALAAGEGPRQRIFLLGYAGWGPSQLEGEIARNDWMTAPADDRLIFSDDSEKTWQEALKRAGTPLLCIQRSL